MIILIDKLAGDVSVDGVVRSVDLSELGADVSTITYDTAKQHGRIKHMPDLSPPKMDSIFGASVYPIFERFYQAWKAAGAVSSRTLAEVKQDKRRQINSTRDMLESAGFPYMGKSIDSNSVSVSRITIVVLAAQAASTAGQAFSIDWTTQDGSVLTLDAAGVIGMPVALAMYANDLHQHARIKKAQIDAATTVAEVDAVEWQ